MKKITNLELLYAARMVVIFVGLTIAVNASNVKSPTMTLFGLILLFTLIVYLFNRRQKREIPGKKDIWSQPVSNRLGAIVINTAVALWIISAAAIAGIFIIISHSIWVTVLALVLVIGVIGVGGQLKKTLSSNSLLAYGITSFAGFCVFLTCVVAVKFH